ncbi:MAG TPA: hypothetical protein VFT56_01165 [Sphingomonas sp.]|nr:hypothetical protein [Sphingomonas sp.]
MASRADLPRLDQLPIPEDVQPGRGWTEQMLEMAAHIGPYATLCIVAAHGGAQVYISRKPESCPFADVIDEEAARILASVYGGNRFQVPVGRAAVDRARRASIIAAVRAGQMTGADAQRILGTSRTYVAYLVNQTAEGQNAEPARARRRHDPRQTDLFA